MDGSRLPTGGIPTSTAFGLINLELGSPLPQMVVVSTAHIPVADKKPKLSVESGQPLFACTTVLKGVSKTNLPRRPRLSWTDESK